MLANPIPLAATSQALRSGQLDLRRHILETLKRIEHSESQVHALLPERGRRARLLREAKNLAARYPDPAQRPLLYGILVGVKDIFHAEGFITRAGTALPSELFSGREAVVVTQLRQAGALLLGKTVTTEFAYFEPGPTRNPHHLEHTPGGSSSGSAAAVAAGLCDLSLGTQTVGSTIRPAAFCGIVGFKPSFGRISTEGVIPFSQSADHVGLFTADVEGMALAAQVLLSDWRTAPTSGQSLPVLGVPEGPYLTQAEPEALAAFEKQLQLLASAGFSVKRVEALQDIESITHRHWRMAGAEMARVHREWFPQFEALYRLRTAQLIREGQQVTTTELDAARRGRTELRLQLQSIMAASGIDLWVTPGAPGPAPHGIHATGQPAMQMPWTHAGMPSVSIPAGRAANGLPLGLQAIATFGADEYLLKAAQPLAHALEPLNSH